MTHWLTITASRDDIFDFPRQNFKTDITGDSTAQCGRGDCCGKKGKNSFSKMLISHQWQRWVHSTPTWSLKNIPVSIFNILRWRRRQEVFPYGLSTLERAPVRIDNEWIVELKIVFPSTKVNARETDTTALHGNIALRKKEDWQRTSWDTHWE